MPITHPYVSAKPDSGDDGEVSSTEWNAAHSVPEHDELGGLGQDDHTIYLKEKDSGGLASEIPAHAHTSAAEGGDLAVATDISTAVSNHAAASDPHAGYRLESADHSHQNTGAQAGQVDHGLALTGLTDDDHTQYLKEKLAGGTAAETPEHTHASSAEAGTVAHSALTGTGVNDHHNRDHASTHSDGGADEVDVVNLAAAETDTALRLAPNGSGGVAWSSGGAGDVAWAIIQASQLVNEFKNFPSLEDADDTQPYWWDEENANITLTEVDVAGESITENYGRALKVVTTGANEYAYQRFTYADEHRLKDGRAVSLLVAVWSVSSAAARVRLRQSSGAALDVSSDVTTAAWNIVALENVTLDGTYVQAEFEVDSGTAYFVPLGFHIGARAFPLRPRAERFRTVIGTRPLAFAGGGSSPFAFTNADLSSVLPALSTRASLAGWGIEQTSGEGYKYHTRAAGSSQSAGDPTARLTWRGADGSRDISAWIEFTGPSRVLSHSLVQDGGSGSIAQLTVYIDGWWEWE